MKESKEVKELRGKILGMEMELNLISKDLNRFKIELLYNEKMKTMIEENLDFLKTTKAAVSLPEYKKIKQQESLVNNRVLYYKTKITPLEQALGRKEDFHKQEMERFEKIYRMQFENNVLEFRNDRRKEV